MSAFASRQKTYVRIGVVRSRLVLKLCLFWSRVAFALLLERNTSGITPNGLVLNESSLHGWGERKTSSSPEWVLEIVQVIAT